MRLVGPDAALIVAITAPITGGRGQQTQLWRLGSTGWVVDAAHVSLPAPAIAGTIWRIVGAPLVDGSGAGALHEQTIAVKDLLDEHRVDHRLEPVQAGRATYWRLSGWRDWTREGLTDSVSADLISLGQLTDRGALDSGISSNAGEQLHTQPHPNLHDLAHQMGQDWRWS